MRGEPIGPQHREGLIALLGDPRVGATLGGVATPATVDAQIARHDAPTGTSTASAGTRSSTAARGALVARGGPQAPTSPDATRSRSAGPSTPIAGVRGWRPSWAPRRSRIAFGPLGLAEVVSFTLTDNRASRRVMEKLGFAYEGETEYAGLPHVLYRLSAASARSTSSSVV